MRTLITLFVSALSAIAIAGSPQGETNLASNSSFTLSPVGSDCIIVGRGLGCAATNMQFNSVYSGTNYVWSLTNNTSLAVFCGVTNQQQVCVMPTQGGSFTLVLDYLFNGIPRNCSYVVTVHEALAISNLADVTACTGEEVSFTTTLLSGEGLVTYSWTFDDGSGAVPIAGADTTTLTISNVALSDAGTYCVTADGECGTVSSCADLIVNECGGESFCTLTQGAYGNDGGQFNGIDRLTLITQLMSTDLIVGKPGRSLNLGSGANAARCVIARLPANSTAAALPDFGDESLDLGTCQTSPIALPLKNGRYKNILLGQTITLSLNTRLDPNLSGLAVCGSMTTQLMSAGPDGLMGTPDDVVDPGPDGILGTTDDQLTVTIPANVLTGLSALGLPQTVGGILELANRALAGQGLGGASASEASGAADAINRAFDECRSLVDCI